MMFPRNGQNSIHMDTVYLCFLKGGVMFEGDIQQGS